MSTLNNQQINPGNRVDFSKIRRTKIHKFEDPDSPLWDFTEMGDQLGSKRHTGQTSSYGLALNLNINGADLEAQDNYSAFTDFVIKHPTNDQVLAYLRTADNKSNPTVSQLFTDEKRETLRSDWAKKFKDLREDGKNGPFHWTPRLMSTSTQEEADLLKMPTQEEADLLKMPTQEEADLLKMPPTPPNYTRGSYAYPAHLLSIYYNNLKGALKNRNLALKKRIPRIQPVLYDSIITNGYAERMANEKKLAEARSRNTSLASLMTDGDKARLFQLDFEALVANPTYLENNKIQATDFSKSSNQTLHTINVNKELNLKTNTLREQYRTAWHDARNLAELKLNTIKASETADLIQKVDESGRKYAAEEKTLHAAHNYNRNLFEYNYELTQALSERNNKLANILTSDDELSDIYNRIIDGYVKRSGDERIATELTDDERQILLNPSYAEDAINILKAFTHNQSINLFIQMYEHRKGLINRAFEELTQYLRTKLNLANLYLKPAYSSSYSEEGDNLDMYWGTIPYKKGGKIKDRMLAYLEHNRKILKDLDHKSATSLKLANKKLLKELDALDKETLLILRSIFK